jgi:hypothetical protein
MLNMGGTIILRVTDQSAEQRRHQQDLDSYRFWDPTMGNIPTGHKC